MDKKVVFCEEYRNDVTFIVENKENSGTVKGETCDYLGKNASCVHCASELYVGELSI